MGRKKKEKVKTATFEAKIKKDPISLTSQTYYYKLPVSKIEFVSEQQKRDFRQAINSSKSATPDNHFHKILLKENFTGKILKEQGTAQFTITQPHSIREENKIIGVDRFKSSIQNHLEGIEEMLKAKGITPRMTSSVDNFTSLYQTLNSHLESRNLVKWMPDLMFPISSLVARLKYHEDINKVYDCKKGELEFKMQVIEGLFNSGMLSKSTWTSHSFWADLYNRLGLELANIPERSLYRPIIDQMSEIKMIAKHRNIKMGVVALLLFEVHNKLKLLYELFGLNDETTTDNETRKRFMKKMERIPPYRLGLNLLAQQSSTF
jgi:hypothetical protein